MIIQHDDMFYFTMIHARFASNMARKMGEFKIPLWALIVESHVLRVPAGNLTVKYASCMLLVCVLIQIGREAEDRKKTKNIKHSGNLTKNAFWPAFSRHFFLCLYTGIGLQNSNILTTRLEILPTNSHCNGVTAWSCCPIMCKSFNDCTLSIEQHGLLYSVARNFPHFPQTYQKSTGFQAIRKGQ